MVIGRAGYGTYAYLYWESSWKTAAWGRRENATRKTLRWIKMKQLLLTGVGYI